MSSKPKPFVFVLMPFDPSFDDVYQLGIKEACKQAGMYCERVDEQLFNERILDRIYNQISKSDIVVADLSGRNANVFYETGYSHGLGKRVILLTKQAEDIPFDLKDYPHIIYKGRVVDLIEPLIKKLKWYISTPEVEPTQTSCPLEIYIDGSKLMMDELNHVHLSYDPWGSALIVNLHNKSNKKYSKNQIRVGVICYRLNSRTGTKQIPQPDGKTLYIGPYNEELYPDEWGEYCIDSWPEDQSEYTVRLFLPLGSFDFPLVVTKEATREPAWDPLPPS
jgi:hypothetical protein